MFYITCMWDSRLDAVSVLKPVQYTEQVLGQAMQIWGISYTNIDSPDMTEAAQHPDQQQAFICNLRVCCMSCC